MEKITLEDFLKLSKEKLQGKVFSFPTDTVYALAALVEDEEAKNKILLLKHRENKPLAILCSNVNQITGYVKKIPDEAKILMEKYWPGGLTIIFEKSEKLQGDLPTVAFRMPNSLLSLKIIDKFGLMYATSVNYSGEKELSNILDIEKAFPDIDYLITDYEKMENVASTIVSAYDDMKIIRQGKLIIK